MEAQKIIILYFFSSLTLGCMSKKIKFHDLGERKIIPIAKKTPPPKEDKKEEPKKEEPKVPTPPPVQKPTPPVPPSSPLVECPVLNLEAVTSKDHYDKGYVKLTSGTLHPTRHRLFAGLAEKVGEFPLHLTFDQKGLKPITCDLLGKHHDHLLFCMFLQHAMLT